MIRGMRGQPLAPVSAQQELEKEFPDCFYEWMPRAKMWCVKRKVPWNEVEKLIAKGRLTEIDVARHLADRQKLGIFGAGDHMVVHAFTLRGPTGEPIEPGTYVVEAMKKADTQKHPEGVRGVLKETIRATLQREAEVDAWYTDQVEQAVQHHDASLRGLPAMAYPNNPIGDTNGKTEAE